MFGKRMTVDEVLDEVEKDASFYRSTGGGITLSGGECLLQPDFSAALLEGAHERGINTAIETACNVPWAFVEKVLPHVDTMLHDHKLTIPERHKKWIGVGNERILENFKKAYETFPDIDFIARTPLIPGVNADEEHIRAVLAFIRPHKNVIDYELLPYHRFGLGKYELPGRGVRAGRLQDAVRRPGPAPPGHHRRGLRPQRRDSPGHEVTSRSRRGCTHDRDGRWNPDDRGTATPDVCGHVTHWSASTRSSEQTASDLKESRP